jgi:biopolymer transport protein ExbB/TolQ
MNGKAPRPPGETLKKVGVALLLLGPLVGLVATVIGLAWSFDRTESVAAANKAQSLADGISSAMLYPAIAGTSSMVIGVAFLIAGAVKSRQARG